MSAGDGIDLWMPVQRADGCKGDYCQIGNHASNKARYVPHIDSFAMPYGTTIPTLRVKGHVKTDPLLKARGLSGGLRESLQEVALH